MAARRDDWLLRAENRDPKELKALLGEVMDTSLPGLEARLLALTSFPPAPAIARVAEAFFAKFPVRFREQLGTACAAVGVAWLHRAKGFSKVKKVKAPNAQVNAWHALMPRALEAALAKRPAEGESAANSGKTRSPSTPLGQNGGPVSIPIGPRAAFQAAHFEHDPNLRFNVVVEPAPPAALGAFALELPDSGPGSLAFSRIGRIAIPFPEGTHSLAVFWMAGYAGGLFIPFRDATNGSETYDAGRYLVDAAKGADLGGDPASSTIIVDFNFAFQPSCAFDARWACPLAPPENRLDLPIRAGERRA